MDNIIEKKTKVVVNEEIQCPCGSIISSLNMRRHKKTQIHKLYEEDGLSRQTREKKVYQYKYDKDRLNKYQQRYREKNKDKYNLYHNKYRNEVKERRDPTEEITVCECGGKYTKYGMERHFNTKVHKLFLEDGKKVEERKKFKTENTIQCPCGGLYTSYGVDRHINTKIHKMYIEDGLSRQERFKKEFDEYKNKKKQK